MALCLAALAASEAEARVIRIEIKRTEPAFVEGKTFGKTGAYEKLVGRAYGEVEPRGTQSSSTSTRRRKTSDVEAPIATYTGWALRAEPAGANDGCDGAGQMIPFAKTKAERTANDDPRPSRQERYPTHDAYVNAVRTAANGLRTQRLLLTKTSRPMCSAQKRLRSDAKKVKQRNILAFSPFSGRESPRKHAASSIDGGTNAMLGRWAFLREGTDVNGY